MQNQNSMEGHTFQKVTMTSRLVTWASEPCISYFLSKMDHSASCIISKWSPQLNCRMYWPHVDTYLKQLSC
jgi:hypothetical protein